MRNYRLMEYFFVIKIDWGFCCLPFFKKYWTDASSTGTKTFETKIPFVSIHGALYTRYWNQYNRYETHMVCQLATFMMMIYFSYTYKDHLDRYFFDVSLFVVNFLCFMAYGSFFSISSARENIELRLCSLMWFLLIHKCSRVSSFCVHSYFLRGTFTYNIIDNHGHMATTHGFCVDVIWLRITAHLHSNVCNGLSCWASTLYVLNKANVIIYTSIFLKCCE